MEDYFGTLNDIRAGLSASPPEKPEALVLYEQCIEMRIPLVAGGVRDQPHIWMQEYAIVKHVKELFEILNQQASQAAAQPAARQRSEAAYGNPQR